MRNVILIQTLLLWLVLHPAPAPAVAEPPSPPPCAYGDKACADKALGMHATKKIAFWQPELAKPLAQRIGVGSPELVEFLALDNIKNGFPNKPRLATLAPDFLRDVQDAFAELPAEVTRLLSSRLAGIYFVEDIGGTGFTDQINDSEGQAVAALIILDPSVLEMRNANAWATWKENTPFKTPSEFNLAAEIETGAHNNRKNAIQYILLHELGHVLSAGGTFHPSWNTLVKDIPSTKEYPFFELSWSIDRSDNRYVTRFDSAFRERKDVVYYFGAKLAGDDMLKTYDALERTSFATLYSATNPFDDFAEAFASYVHTVMMKKPFEIRITRDGKTAKVFKSCWMEPRCAEKRKILENFLYRK